MIDIKRSPENPILIPEVENPWEAAAVFNPSVAEGDGEIRMVYRAVSKPQNVAGAAVEISSIGHATSKDGIRFGEREQIIKPEYDWEKFGCEDPRITRFENNYFIFYTALSTFPFSADGIKVAVAVTKDFKKFEKHLVTPFNAKAMALFPERINGKIAAVLTVNTDRPPAKICLALFDNIEDIWSETYWREWHKNLDSHAIPFKKDDRDHLEIGSPPLRTAAGWLIFYSYIYDYFSPPPVFGVQAVLLDLNDPRKIAGEVQRPLLTPAEEYELYGRVPYVIFPSGALIRRSRVFLYYGAADTIGCLASIGLKKLVNQLVAVSERQLIRCEQNPIIAPVAAHVWESKATFNPGAIYESGKTHLVYRALSEDNTSVFGYASARDGERIDERLPDPVYAPREDFEKKLVSGGNSGCEDPRLTKIGGAIYMCYTAFDGKNPPRVALTSISVKNFLNKNWQWAKPVLISLPGVDNKDAALFPKKIKGKFVFLHRQGGEKIWIDFVDSLDFGNGRWLGGKVLMGPRETEWDSRRIGIASPPIATKAGWLILYHGISKRTSHYNIRAALLDTNNPAKILYRTHDTILEPETLYEKNGLVPNVVFPCGAVVVKDRLFVYYGAADKVVCAAAVDLKNLLDGIMRE